MAGWLLFAAMAAVAGSALWSLRYPRALATFGLAAVALAGAGYAWQGKPGTAGRPTSAQATSYTMDDGTLALRNAMFGRYGAIALYLTPADAMLRFGHADSAARMLQGGIRRDPGSVALWTQLGTVIAMRDGDASPAATFAFRRAIALGPGEPGPWFFFGMAHLRGGRFADARDAWSRAVALTPTGYPYRAELVRRLAILDAFMRQPAGPGLR